MLDYYYYYYYYYHYYHDYDYYDFFYNKVQLYTFSGMPSSGCMNGLFFLSKITTASSGLLPPGPSSRHWSP